MAKSTQDMTLGVGIDIGAAQKGLDKLLGMLEAFAAKANRVKIKLDIQADLAAKAIEDGLRDSKASPPKASPKSAPRPAPSDGAPPPKGGAPPKGAPSPESAGPSLESAVAAQEQRLAALRAKYQGDTKRQDRKLTEDLIDNIGHLMDEKRKLISADALLTDKSEKAKLAAKKKGIDDELGMLRRVAAEKDSVVNEGAGAKAGMMGIFRKVAGTGALQLAAVAQTAQAVGEAVEQLSGPFREFDTAVRGIGALGVKNFKDFEGEILKFSTTVPDAAADIASAIGDAVGSGIVDVNEKGQANIRQGLEFAQTASQLAIAGGSKIGTAVSGIAGTLNAYGMAASDAGKISDELFNIFNLGVATVDDLAANLSNVTPVAAAAGVPFEQIGAAVATMTKQGSKVPDVTTKLKAFLVELQKPQPALSAILKQAGVSIDQIKSGELSLQSASQRIATTAAAMGKSIPAIFGSIDAAGVVLGLTGANAATAMEDLAGIAERGTVAKGFAVQADGAEVKMKTLLNNVQAGFITLFGALGNGVTASLGAIAQVGPSIATLAGLKQIIPPGMFDGIINGAEKLLPKLVEMGVLRVSGTAATAASAAANLADAAASTADAAAKEAQTVATEEATIAQYGLNTAVLTNPYVLIAVAIVALIVAFYLLYAKVKPVRDFINGMFAGIMPVLRQIGSMFMDLGGLVLDFILMPFKLIWAVISGLGSLIGKLVSGIMGLFGGVSSGGGIMRSIFDKVRMGIIGLQVAITYAKVALETLVDSVGKLLSGDFSGAWDSFVNGAEKAGAEAGKKLKEELRKKMIDDGDTALEDAVGIKGDLDKAGRIAQLRQRLAAAKTDAEKQGIAQAIAAEIPEAVRGTTNLVDAQGRVTEVIKLSGEEMDNFAERSRAAAEGSGEDKSKVIQGFLAQGEVIDEAKKKLEMLQQQQANQKAVGGDTTQVEKDMAEQQKIVEEGQAKLAEGIKTAQGAGVFQGLDEQGQQAYDRLKRVQADTFTQMETQARDTKIGEALGEAARLTGKIDDSGRLKEFINEYNSTTDATKKKNIAGAIKEMMPDAVAQYDALGNVIGVNTEGLEDLAEKQRDAWGSDIQSQQVAFTDGLKDQADEVAEGQDGLVKLREKITQASDPKEVAKLKAEYEKLKVKVGENAGKLAENIQKGKQFGLIKGDVNKVGAEFGFSAKQARGAATAVELIGGQTKEAKADVAALATEFNTMNSEAKKAVDDDIAALAFERVKKKMGEVLDEKQQAAADEARKRIGADVKNLKLIQAVQKEITDQYLGNDKKKQQSAKKVDTFEEERRKQQAQFRAAEIKDEIERKRFEIAEELRAAREANRIARQRAQNEYAVSQKDTEARKARDEKILDANNTLSLAESGATEKRKALAIEAREKMGIDVLKAETDGTSAYAASLRADSDALTEQDVASVRRRGELVTEAIRIENGTKLDAEIEGNAEFQAYAKDYANTEITAVLTAQEQLANAEQAAYDRRRELQEKADARRTALAEGPKKLSAEEIAADPELQRLEAAIETDAKLAELEGKASDQGNILVVARTAMAGRMAEARKDFLAAMTLPASELSDAQRALLAALPAAGSAEREKFIANLQTIITAGQTAAMKQGKAFEDEMRDAMMKARLATITDAGELERAQRDYETEKTYRETLKVLEQGEAEINRLLSESGVERGKIIAQFMKELGEATTEEERTAAYYRRDIAMQEVDAKYGSEADLYGQLNGLRLARGLAEAKAARARQESEEKHLADTNAVWRFAYDLRFSIVESFNQKLDDAEAQQLQKQRDDLESEEFDLLDSLKRREISYRDFLSKINDMESQKVELDRQIEEQKFDIGKQFQKAGEVAARTMAQESTKSAATAGDEALLLMQQREAYKQQLINDGLDEEMAATKAGQQFNEDISNRRVTSIVGAGIAVTSKLGELAAQQKQKFGEYAAAGLDIAFKSLQAQIPGWILGIFGSSVAQLGPIAGPLVAAGITTTLYGLVSVAESAMTTGQGFASGGYTGDGGKHEAAGTVHRGEVVINSDVTRGWKMELLRINAGEDPREVFGEKVSEWSVGANGKLQRFADRVHNSVEAVHALAMQALDAVAASDRSISMTGRLVPSLVHDLSAWGAHQQVMNVQLHHVAQVEPPAGVDLGVIARKLDRLEKIERLLGKRGPIAKATGDVGKAVRESAPVVNVGGGAAYRKLSR